MSLHATLEQTDNVRIVRILREAKTSAVVHELFELVGDVPTELVDGYFFLFLLNVGVLFSLRSSWEALPGK